MKAVTFDRYGSPDVLQIEEVPTPQPDGNEVVVKVLATSVTSGDWHLRKADPFLVRFYNGLTKPRRHRILGSEFAGIVDAVGPDVQSFRSGDRVFGASNDRLGAHAEYLSTPEERHVTHLPPETEWNDAASIPFGALTALYFLRDLGRVSAGQSILINGASGSVGAYSVQLAKHYGLEVTGVCSTRNVDMVRSLGADHVIDYTTTDVVSTGETYDIVFDTVGTLSYMGSRRILKPEGAFLTTSLGPKQMLQMGWSRVAGKSVRAGIARNSSGDMKVIADLMKSGAIRPVVDTVYPLNRIAEAHAYVETGRKRGTVVIAPVQLEEADHSDHSG